MVYNKTVLYRLSLIAPFLLASVIAKAAETETPPTSEASTADIPSVSYHTDVLPVLRANCFGCHQGAKQLGEYRMTDFAAMVLGGETGQPAIVPGNSSESYLIDQIELHDGVAEMPKPPQKPLHATEVDLIRTWIDQGAINDAPASIGPQYNPEHPPVYTGPPTLPSLDLAPNGETLAVAGYHEIVLLDPQSGEVAKRLIGQSPRINTVRFSPDGTRIAAAAGTPGELGELQIWNVASGSLELSKIVTYDTIGGLAWTPDGQRVAVGCNDNTVRGFDVETGEQFLFQGAHEDWIRDTVFTADGKHLVSVARDMTCKLTEVETERFIDNVTSITPGALSGGLSSVTVHPTRDEIVVGGADGVVKVYRIFRQTKRQIGDDANLVRNMPKMTGRIRQVVVSPDGGLIGAVATIDGKSEVRVWKYDFTGELTKELKDVLAKRVSSRSAAEKKKISGSVGAEAASTLTYQLDTAAYSLELTNEGEVFLAASDGEIRHLDAAGKLLKHYPVAKIAASVKDGVQDFRPAKQVAAPVPTSALPPLAELNITPDRIALTSPYAYAQLVATGTLADGSTVDVSELIEIADNQAFVTEPGGLIRPTKDSKGTVQVRVGDTVKEIAFEFTGQSHFEVDFVRDVNPVLSRLGCNQGTCHGAQKGKNGFRLSLRGYDPIFDIRALTDDLAARRINPASPEDSMMLRKPLGLTPHEGGVVMKDGDDYHAVLRKWIADGSKLDLETPRVTALEIFPKNPVVQSTQGRQQVRVLATYTDGQTRDVTREAFIDSGNTDVATTSKGGILQAVRRGEAPVLARYEGSYAATTLTVMGDRSGYESHQVESWNRIDELVAAKWERMKIIPSGVSDDATFLRRLHLDLTGLPPSSETVREFLADETPSREKRSAIIEKLIGNEDFIEYWTNKWADLLQVNRKFLGVDGSKKYRQWIRQAVSENRPYDELARQILTATGSNNTNPPASYYKVLRTAEDTMENTTHLFLGIRFNCNKCHDHPFERWTQDQYYEMAAFFAKVDRKADPEAKGKKIGGTAVEGATPLYEIIGDAAKLEVKHARTGDDVMPSFPYDLATSTQAKVAPHAPLPEKVPGVRGDEKAVTLVSNQPKTAPDKETPDPTRREQLAQWMTDPGNPYFARSYVNRIWGYLTGVGLIEPIDDIRAGNPPTNPELLDFLTNEFIASDFDTRHLMRLITSSRTYGLSVESNPLNEDDHQNYSHATPRRLPAEVIYDAVHSLTGAISKIPGMPDGSRAAAATDSGVSLTDGFLANLGRPVRETACECERSTDLQLGPVMALISGPTIGTAIADPKNELEKIVADHPTDDAVVQEIFLRALGRFPTPMELKVFANMNDQIAGDHQTLAKRLENAEADWKVTQPELEAARLATLAGIKADITAREKAIQPERTKMEAERQAKIKAAQEKLDAEIAKLPGKASAWIAKHQSSIEWHPLFPKSATATNKSTLTVQPDRSILASGEKGNGSYLVDFETSLSGVTGFRIEALTDASLPSNGPGRASNFVVTEVTVNAGPVSDPKNFPKLKIASGHADFLQNGFNIKLAFDGNAGNQAAWAVSGATGVEHWATFQFESPIKVDGKTRLRFNIAQNHNAKEHLLGRFRISLTTDGDKIGLDLNESLAAIAGTPVKELTETQSKSLHQYISTNDKPITDAKNAVSTAKKALPADEQIVALQKKQKRYEPETPIDLKLVQLRANVEQSTSQLKHQRLTAAEDLVWALVNTPAFLFNH